MISLQVGANKPIKLKVTSSTVAHAITYTYLNDTANAGKFIPDINAFSNTDSTGWKQINDGDEVQGRTLKVMTFLSFFNEIHDENTFNLIVDQAKAGYIVQISGGTPSPSQIDFITSPSFQNKTVVFSSLVDLT